MVTSLAISEVFGPTLQGEGPHTGEAAIFVRLAGCNLACSWCDTPYSWDWDRYDKAAEVTTRTVWDIVGEVQRRGAGAVGLVILTGGEPLVQQRRLAVLADQLATRGFAIDVETNGTIAPDGVLVGAVRTFVVSPKLDNAGMARRRTRRPGALAALAATGKAVLKAVVERPEELAEVRELAAFMPGCPVYILPQARTAAELDARTRALAQPVAEAGWALSTRLQIVFAGGVRGH